MGNLIIEIPPIGARDCYYIQERYKPCFNYPLHKYKDIASGNFARAAA